MTDPDPPPRPTPPHPATPDDDAAVAACTGTDPSPSPGSSARTAGSWPNLAPVLSTKTIDWDLIRQQYDENWNSANHDLFYGKDGGLTGSDKESQEVSMLALHLLRSALVHVNTLLLQDILSEEKRNKRLTDADRRALSPLFWTHVSPYGRFELDMNSHLDLAAAAATARLAPAPRPGWKPVSRRRTRRPGTRCGVVSCRVCRSGRPVCLPRCRVACGPVRQPKGSCRWWWRGRRACPARRALCLRRWRCGGRRG